ncbi:MAG TPA: DUF4129 domain-containing protein [bacterium]|nr:DUF4129 domain-containing protein [bacterium]
MSYASLRRWAPLLLPAAEFTWLYPWLLLVSGAANLDGAAALTPMAALGLLMGGYLLEMIPAPEGRAGLRVRLGVLAGALLLGLWAVWTSHYRPAPLWNPEWVRGVLQAAHDALPEIPAPALGALLAPLLLWRGMALGSREFSHFSADAAFRRGLAWSVGFALLFGIFQGARGFALVRPAAGGYLLAFVFLSLVMLSLARLLSLWAEARARGMHAPPNRPWLALAIGVPALIVLAAGMLGGLAGADVWPYLRPIVRLLAPLVEAVFIVLFFVAGFIARILIFAISRIPRREPVVRPEEPLGPLDELLRRLRDFTPSPEVVSDARWGLVALAILIFSLIILAVAARRRSRARAEDEDDRESVWDRADLWKGLRQLFLRRRPARAPVEAADTPARLAVRMLYRRVLAAARAAGITRRGDQTPREFAARLRADAALEGPALSGITRAYEVVRYGARDPSAEEIRASEEHTVWLEDELQRRSADG